MADRVTLISPCRLCGAVLWSAAPRRLRRGPFSPRRPRHPTRVSAQFFVPVELHASTRSSRQRRLRTWRSSQRALIRQSSAPKRYRLGQILQAFCGAEAVCLLARAIHCALRMRDMKRELARCHPARGVVSGRIGESWVGHQYMMPFASEFRRSTRRIAVMRTWRQ